MDIEAFREYCLSLKGTTEDVKWEDNLCFLVEGKIFVLCSLTHPHGFAIKIEPEDFDAIISRTGIKQAFHMAKRQWIGIENLEVLTDKELKDRVAHSRKLVIAKLSKRLQLKYSSDDFKSSDE